MNRHGEASLMCFAHGKDTYRYILTAIDDLTRIGYARMYMHHEVVYIGDKWYNNIFFQERR